MSIILASHGGARSRFFCAKSVWLLGLAWLASFLPASAAMAGGGPEGLLLVINPRSETSMAIGNYYAWLRQIPLDNLVYVPWDPEKQNCGIDEFRTQILLPALQSIQSRHLANQIDAIIYSSDYPWGINLDTDIAKFTKAMQNSRPPGEGEHGNGSPKPNNGAGQWPKQITPVGSPNGLTYLWQSVIAQHPAYLDMTSNRYMRLPIFEQDGASCIGFRGTLQFGRRGELVEKDGARYFLSMMLGVTVGRGNTLKEVLDYLERSATADGIHPDGTIYLTKTKDVRSEVRQKIYPTVVEELEKLGVKYKIIETAAPYNAKDVQGVVMGTPNFDWKSMNNVILPGAFCDNFTSFGGIMRETAGQTPLTEFLRYGAAGASGTVTEPFALLNKFPLPMSQVYYARGCTLAEALYQSIYCPYQLLLVGDPLCRPWADIPKVKVSGVEPGSTVKGVVTLKPEAVVPGNQPATSFELYVDGFRAAVCKPGERLSLDTARLADGHHELRVVAVGPPPIYSQGRQIFSILTDNHQRKIEVKLESKPRMTIHDMVVLSAKSPDSVAIVALQGSRLVGRIEGNEGQIEIPAKTLGAGNVRIRIAGLGAQGSVSNVLAEPIKLVIE